MSPPALRLLPAIVLVCALPALTALLGCETVCTLAGCEDGLTVRLQGSVPDAYTIEAISRSTGDTLTKFCPPPDADSGVDCTRDMGWFFRFFTPEEVTIRVSWDGGEVIQTFQPDYGIYRPNGPACPPECKQGSVAVQLPG